MQQARSNKTKRARDLRRNSTDAERLLWAQLRARRLSAQRFVRQHPIGPFIADFLCREANLIIELDGGQHADQVDSDAVRTQQLEANGYRVIRFWNNDVLSNMDGVLREILRALNHPSPQPSPRKRGEGAGGARGEGVAGTRC